MNLDIIINILLILNILTLSYLLIRNLVSRNKEGEKEWK